MSFISCDVEASIPDKLQQNMQSDKHTIADAK